MAEGGRRPNRPTRPKHKVKHNPKVKDEVMVEHKVKEVKTKVKLDLCQHCHREYKKNCPFVALTHALEERHLKCVRNMVETGTGVNKPEGYLPHPLITTSRIGYSEGLKYLISAGADINHVNKYGTVCPLSVAAENSHLICMEILIREGADINLTGLEDKTTTILMALVTCSSDPAPVELLLSAGVEVGHKTRNGLNALQLHLLDMDYNKEPSDVICMLLYAAGETLEGDVVAGFARYHQWRETPTPECIRFHMNNQSLKHLSREAIRRHMLDVDLQNLFGRLPLTGLPPSLILYCLYGVTLNDDDFWT